MFEGWVANLLNRVLGSYVEEGCFRPDKVSTSIYGGHMVLSELEIRKDAFDTVGVPIKLRRGFIGQVDVKIPWTHLGSQPVEIAIDRVFLILEPSLEYNERDYRRKLKARKKADLARAELRKSSGFDSVGDPSDETGAIARANMSEAEEMAKAGFTARLMNKVVDNIELNVRNVHVRYEDRVTNPKHAFSVGVTWESLKMQSTDRHWTPCFVDLVAEIKRRLGESGKYLEKLLAYKLFKLEHFALYWDPFPGTTADGTGLDYTTCTFAEMAATFERMIPKRQQQEEEDYRLVDREARRALSRHTGAGTPSENAGAGSVGELTDGRGSASERPLEDAERIRSAAAAAAAAASASHQKTRARLGTGAQHCFILEPVSLTLKMQSNRDPRFPDSPDTVLDLDIETVTLVLERFQFLDAWEMLAAFDAAEKSYPYAQLRPQGVTVRDAPRIWWQFAVRATLEDVQERRRRFSAEYIINRRHDRLLYIDLWKRSLAGRPRSEVAASSSGTPRRDRKAAVQSAAMAADSPLQLRRDMMRRGRRIADLQNTPRTPNGEKRLRNGGGDDDASSFQDAVEPGDAASSAAGEDDQIDDTASSIVITDYLELSSHEQTILENLEDIYDVEDIMYFRSLAENQLRLERAHLHLVEIERRASGLPPTEKAGSRDDTPGWAGAVFGWAGWAVGLGGSSASGNTQQRPATPAAATAAAQGQERPLMTREEQARLFEMLDFDPTEILEPKNGSHRGGSGPESGRAKTPPGGSRSTGGNLSKGGKGGASKGGSNQTRGVRIVSVMRFRMEECRLQLWDNANPANAVATPDLLVDAHFLGTSVRVSKRENGTDRALLSLENLEVYDWCAKDERFARIVSLKEMSGAGAGGLADNLSSGVSAFSDFDRASHITPPAWSGTAERMELNYRKRKAMERQMLQRSARHSDRRRHSTSMTSAAWAASLGGFDIPGTASLMEGDDGHPLPEPLMPSYSEYEPTRRGIGEIDESTSYPEGLSEDGGTSSHRPFRGRLPPGDAGSDMWGVRSSRGRGVRSSRARASAVFSLEVDSHCPETGADVALRVRLRPLELVYSPVCVDRVSTAFQIPDSVFTYREAQLASINNFSNVQSRNRAKVEYAYQNHFSVSMDVDMQAPLLILPQHVPLSTPEEDIKLVLVDFGRMTIRDKALSPVKRDARSPPDVSEAAQKARKRTTRDLDEAQTQQSARSKFFASPSLEAINSPSSSLDPPRLRVRGTTGSIVESTLSTSEMSRFFDEYKISCSEVQVLATSLDTNWRSSAEQHRRHMHVIDRFTFNVVLCVSILQYDRTLPQYKLFANLPSLHIHLTPEKLDAMAQVANSLQAASDTPASTSNYRGFDVGELVIGGDGSTTAAGPVHMAGSRGDASPRYASMSEFASPYQQSASPALAGLTGIETLAPLDGRMPSLLLNSSAESVSSSTGPVGTLRQSRFLRLPSSASVSASTTAATTTATGSGERSPRRSHSFTDASSSGPSAAPQSPRRAGSRRRMDGSDWESASIAASLHETLRTDDDGMATAIDEGTNGGVDDIDDFDNDFYTTVGSVAHTSFRRQLSENESVSSFVSALQGDELDEGGIRQDSASVGDESPRARTNISYLQCSMNVAFIMLSISRPKTVSGAAANTTQTTAKNAARARRRSFGLDTDDGSSLRRHPSTDGATALARLDSGASRTFAESDGTLRAGTDSQSGLASPRQKAVVNPNVREWLDELVELERAEGSPSLFPYSRNSKTPTKTLDAAVKQSATSNSRDASRSSKIKRFSTSLLDEALDEVLAGESDDDNYDAGAAEDDDGEGDRKDQGSENELERSIINGVEVAARTDIYEEYEGIVLVLVENISMHASLRTMETSVDFSMRSVTIHDVMGQDLTEVRLGPGIAERLAQFPQLVRRAKNQPAARTRSSLRLQDRRSDRPRLLSEAEGDGSFLALGLRALAKDSPLYGGVGADLRISGGAIDVTFSQVVLSALLDAFGSVAMASNQAETSAPAGSSSGPPPPPLPPRPVDPALLGAHADAIQAQVQATLKQLTISFVGVRAKQHAVRQSRAGVQEATSANGQNGAQGRAQDFRKNANDLLAELTVHELEMRAASREDGQSSVSARLGNFSLRDCLTGIGSSLEQHHSANLSDAAFTISEKELSLGKEEPLGVLIVGSRRRENDKRPLFLLQSTFYSDEWRRQRLVVPSPNADESPAAKAFSTPSDDPARDEVERPAEQDDERKRASFDEPRSAGRDSLPHLDLDDVLDSYLRDSPPASPHAHSTPGIETPPPSRQKPLKATVGASAATTGRTPWESGPGEGCGHRGCRANLDNGTTNLASKVPADLEEAQRVAVPALPLRADVQFQVRSFVCRANVDFLHAVVDYIYEGELLRSLSRNMEYAVIREDQNLESTRSDHKDDHGDGDDSDSERMVDENGGTIGTIKENGAERRPTKGSRLMSRESAASRLELDPTKVERLVDLDSLQILLFDCSLEIPSTQQGSPMGMLHVGAVDLHNRFFLGDSSNEEQVSLLHNKPGGALAMHAVEAISVQVTNLSMQVPESTSTGTTASFKLIQDTSIRARTVRHIGTAWVCRAKHDPLCSKEFTEADLESFWTWNMTPRAPSAGAQAIKSKVDVGHLALRISEVHVATLSGLLDHLAGLDVEDVAVKLRNIQAQIDPSGTDGADVPTGAPDAGLGLFANDFEGASQASPCSCSIASGRGQHEDVNAPADEVKVSSSETPGEEDSQAPKHSDAVPSAARKSPADTLVLDVDFEFAKLSLEVLWSSASGTGRHGGLNSGVGGVGLGPSVSGPQSTPVATPPPPNVGPGFGPRSTLFTRRGSVRRSMSMRQAKAEPLAHLELGPFVASFAQTRRGSQTGELQVAKLSLTDRRPKHLRDASDSMVDAGGLGPEKLHRFGSLSSSSSSSSSSHNGDAGGLIIEEDQELPFILADWSYVRLKPRRRPDRASFVEQTTEETIKVRLANTQLCLVQALVLAGARWVNEAQSHATMQGLWPPRFPDMSVPEADAPGESAAIVASESQSRGGGGGGGSTVTDKTAFPYYLDRAKSLVSRSSAGPGSVVSRPSLSRSAGASRVNDTAFRSPMPGSRFLSGVDSASVAPVYSWASDSGDEGSERANLSPQARKLRPRAMLPMKSMLKETVTNVRVDVVGLEVHVMERPKQKDSRALTACLNFSLATRLSSGVVQRDLIVRSSFPIARKAFKVATRPEWMLDMNGCSVRLGARQQQGDLALQRPGSAGSQASRDAAARAQQQTSILVQPFQASVRYRVGAREGSSRPTHLLDAGVGQIDSQITYNEIRAVADIAQRLVHFSTQLESAVQGGSGSASAAGGRESSPPGHTAGAYRGGQGRDLGFSEVGAAAGDGGQSAYTDADARQAGSAPRAKSDLHQQQRAQHETEATQGKSAAARAAVGELAEKTLGASVAGAHFSLDFTGARFLLVDDMHGQSSPVVELIARRSDSDIDIGPNGLLARICIAIGADSYNHRLGAWEPLLEPWRVHVRALVPIADKGQSCGLRMSASVDSQTILNLNLTEAFVESISGATQIWNPEKTHVGRGEFQRDSVSLFRIYNETGLPIAFWTRDTDMRPLQSGSEMPIQFDGLSIATGRRDGPEAESRKVSLIMHSPDSRVKESPWQPLQNIPLDREGSFLFRLGATSKHPEVRAVTITCDVVAVGSAKVVCVRSNLLLRNHCVGPMEVVVPKPGAPTQERQGENALFKHRLAPGEVIPVPVHVAELINAHIVKVSVRPSAYSSPYDFQPVSLPADLSPDCSESSSMRTTLDFAAGGNDGQDRDHLVSYCAVDCRSGADAVKALSSSTWDQDSRSSGSGGFGSSANLNSFVGGDGFGSGLGGGSTGSEARTGGSGLHGVGGLGGGGSGPRRFGDSGWRSSGYPGRGASAPGGGASGQKASFASTAAAAAAALNGQQFGTRNRESARRLTRRKPWTKRRFGDASPHQSGTSLRIISFEAPLLVSNLLASPVTYRLRAQGATDAAADGQLPVGNSLRWQGVRPEATLSLKMRLPGFDWSSALNLDAVPFIRPRSGSTVAPASATAAAASAAALRKNNSTSSMSVGSQGTGIGVKIEEKQAEEDVVAGTDRLGDGSLRWSALQEDARLGLLHHESIHLKDSNRRTLTVSAELSVLPGGIRKLVLYVPYWIVNLSDLHLLVRSASRSASLAETFGGHIAAGQNDAMAVMRRLRMRQKLGERYMNRRGVTGERRAPGGLLDLLDDTVMHGDKRSGEPLMFSYTDRRRKKGRICVRGPDSGWSQAMGLDSAGTAGLIELKQQWNVKSDSPRQLFVLGVSIAVADGQFRRTKVITLTPRFVLINALGRTLKVKQRPLGHGPPVGSVLDLFGLGSASRLLGSKNVDAQQGLYGSTSALTSASERADSIRPGERTPYHWRDASAPREICVRFDEYGWIWSGGFSIDNIGEFYVRLRNEHTHAVYILRVDVSLDRANASGSSTIFITFRPELPSLPPYRIDNLSLQTLRLYQRGAPPQTQQVLLPYHSCPYTWDDLSLSRMLVVESLANSSTSSVSRRRDTSDESLRGKASALLGGIWNMLWDQTGVGSNAVDARPVTLGHIELDRLQLATPSTQLPHITIGVHADGPTRVLSIVDARNKAPGDAANPVHPLDGSAPGALDENWWTVFPSTQEAPGRIGVDEVQVDDLFRDDVFDPMAAATALTSPSLGLELASPVTGDVDAGPSRDRDESSSMGFDMSYVGEASLHSPNDHFGLGRPRQGTQDTVEVLLHRPTSEPVASDTIAEDEPFEDPRLTLGRGKHQALPRLQEGSENGSSHSAVDGGTPNSEQAVGALPGQGRAQERQHHSMLQSNRQPQLQSQRWRRRQQQQQQQQQQLHALQAHEQRQSSGRALQKKPGVGPSEPRESLLASWMELKLSLRGVGLSIVESVPRRELLYVTVLEIRSRIESVADLSRLQLRVGWIQADNQLYGAFYPVMFAPRSWNRTAMRFDQLGDAGEEGERGSRSRSPSTLPMVTQDTSADPAHLYTRSPRVQDASDSLPHEGSDQGALVTSTATGGGRNAVAGFGSGSGGGDDDDDERKPFAEFALVRSTKFPSLDFVRHVNVRILPMNLKLEPDVLAALLAFSSRCGTTLRSVNRWSGDGAESMSAPFVGSSLGATSQDAGKGFSRAGASATRDVVLSGGRRVDPSASLLEPMTHSLKVKTVPGAGQGSSVGGAASQSLPPPPPAPAGSALTQEALYRSSSAGAAVAEAGARDGATPEPEPALGAPAPTRPSFATSFSSTASVSATGAAAAPSFQAAGGRASANRGMSESPQLAPDGHGGPAAGPAEMPRATRDADEHAPGHGGKAESLPASQRKLYIEELQVHPVKMHVSFSFRSSAMRTHGYQDPGFGVNGQYHAGSTESGSVNPLRFALNAMGASLANVDNAPLRLNALVLQNSLSTPETILGRIFAHYRSQALRQAYLILGSVDLLGDPRGLVQNLGAGVLDFFYEPALGLVRSPKDFGAGLAKGTMSLLRRTVLGAATSATGFANGVSALFETLSNDRYTGFKPRSFAEGMAQGLAGLVVAPFNGFQEEGALGLGQGLFYGVTGVFVKPLAGLLKLVKHVSVAIQSTIDPTVKFRRHRIRPPRYFIRLAGDNTPASDTANKLLVPFDLHKAVGEEVIAMVDHGVYLDEGHLAHVVLEQPLLADDLGTKRDEILRSSPGLSGAAAAAAAAQPTPASPSPEASRSLSPLSSASSPTPSLSSSSSSSSSVASAPEPAATEDGETAESEQVEPEEATLGPLENRNRWRASLIDVRRSETISGAVLSPAAVLVGQEEGAFETIGGGVATSDDEAEARAVDAAWRASRMFSFFTFHAKRPFPALPLWKRMFLVATNQHLLYVEQSPELERSTWVVPLRSVMKVDLRLVELSIEDEEGDEGLHLERNASGAEVSRGVVLRYWLVEVSTPADTAAVYCWTENQAKACVFFVRTLI